MANQPIGTKEVTLAKRMLRTKRGASRNQIAESLGITARRALQLIERAKAKAVRVERDGRTIIYQVIR